MKYNLADITVLDSYSDTLSILEYETISNSINEMDNSLALVTLLQTIKENSSLFSTIISTEIGFLQESVENIPLLQADTIVDDDIEKVEDKEVGDILKNCILLSKLKEIFEDSTKAEHIIVYNSLTESTPETKAVEYFNEEMIALRNIVREEIRSFMSQYQTIRREDASFKHIKKISYSLSNLIIRLNKLSKDSMRKSAGSFLSQKSLEDQFIFFHSFFQEHVPQGLSKAPNLLAHQSDINEKNEEIIDAELNDVDEEATDEVVGSETREEIEKLKEAVRQMIESMKSLSSDMQAIKEESTQGTQAPLSEQEIANKIAGIINNQINTSESEQEDERLQALNEKVDLVDRKVDNALESIVELSANFNGFIENQTNFTKLIKERYSIDI